MSVAARLNYYRRISSAYLLPGKSQLTFWHDQPQENSGARIDQLGEYYMPFVEKAGYAGAYDSDRLTRYSGSLSRIAAMRTSRARSAAASPPTLIL